MIEIDGKIYRNLEEQVRKNKEDIESIDTNVIRNTNAITGINNRLDNPDLTYATDEDIQNLQSQINTKANQSDLNSTNSRVSTLESTVTQLSPQVAKSLKTPMSAPSSTELVVIDTSNGQAMISIGAGLVIENDTLKSTGGTQIIDNLTSTSISAALSANQGRVLNNTISTVTSSVDSNTEQIEFLQADMAGKTNVTINNVHQDYINFSSDPQTQINSTNSQLNSLTREVAENTTNIETKANLDASNLSTTNVESWQRKLNQYLATETFTTESGSIGTRNYNGQATVVESWVSSDGLTWYRKWSDGWKECGGLYEFTEGGSGNYTNFVMPITFNQIPMTSNVTLVYDETNWSFPFYITNLSKDKFGVYKYSTVAMKFSYYFAGF